MSQPIKTCTRCGQPANTDDVACLKCGCEFRFDVKSGLPFEEDNPFAFAATIPKSLTITKAYEKRQRQKAMTFTAGVMGLVALAGAGLVFYVKKHPSPAPPAAARKASSPASFAMPSSYALPASNPLPSPTRPTVRSVVRNPVPVPVQVPSQPVPPLSIQNYRTNNQTPQPQQAEDLAKLTNAKLDAWLSEADRIALPGLEIPSCLDNYHFGVDLGPWRFGAHVEIEDGKTKVQDAISKMQRLQIPQDIPASLQQQLTAVKTGYLSGLTEMYRAWGIMASILGTDLQRPNTDYWARNGQPVAEHARKTVQDTRDFGQRLQP